MGLHYGAQVNNSVFLDKEGVCSEVHRFSGRTDRAWASMRGVRCWLQSSVEFSRIACFLNPCLCSSKKDDNVVESPLYPPVASQMDAHNMNIFVSFHPTVHLF